MDYEYLIFIGRFQPFHKGHEWVVRQALDRADKVILLIGSADRPCTPKNPFSYDERCDMVNQVLADVVDRLICLPLPDMLYNDSKWLQMIQRLIAPFVENKTAGIIGHYKDNSSYYLRLFTNLTVHTLSNYKGISSTPIRQAYFEGRLQNVSNELPVATQNWLMTFWQTPTYATLKAQYQHIKAYKAQFAALRYPPIFQTADALVVCQGYVLVVQRGGDYGKDLLALPGGFVDADESIAHAAKRELLEETGLDIDKFGADGVPVAIRTIDNPSRSLRGRTITTVFVYRLNTNDLPILSASDDAKQTLWLPLYKLSSLQFFEDHYDIITLLLGVE